MKRKEIPLDATAGKARFGSLIEFYSDGSLLVNEQLIPDGVTIDLKFHGVQVWRTNEYGAMLYVRGADGTMCQFRFESEVWLRCFDIESPDGLFEPFRKVAGREGLPTAILWWIAGALFFFLGLLYMMYGYGVKMPIPESIWP